MPRTQLTEGEHLACYLTRTLGLSHNVGRTLWRQFPERWQNRCRLDQFERAVRRIATEHSLIDPITDENGAGSQYYAEVYRLEHFCQLSFWEKRPDVNVNLCVLLTSHMLDIGQQPVSVYNQSSSCVPDIGFTRILPRLRHFWPVPDYVSYTGDEAGDAGIHGQKGETLLQEARRYAEWLHLLNALSKLLSREGWVQRGARMKSTGCPHFKWDGDRVRVKNEAYRTLSFVDLYSDDPGRDGICLLKLDRVWGRLGNGDLGCFTIHCSYSQQVGDQEAPPQAHHDLGVLPPQADMFKLIEFMIVELGPRRQRNRLHSLKRTFDAYIESIPGIVWLKKPTASPTALETATE